MKILNEKILMDLLDHLLNDTVYYSYYDIFTDMTPQESTINVEVFNKTKLFKKFFKRRLIDEKLDKYFFIKNSQYQSNVFIFGTKGYFNKYRNQLIALFILKGIINECEL